MNKKHLYILCGLLVLIGVAVTAYRSLVLEFPLTPNETTSTCLAPKFCAIPD